jgi:hypothetical protein
MQKNYILSNDQINILKSVLQELCINGKTIKRSYIFSKFEERAKSELELYRFEQIISKLIKDNIIKEYEIKVGRNGGISKKEDTELIIINCSYGIYRSYINKTKLNKLINSLHLKQDIKHD